MHNDMNAMIVNTFYLCFELMTAYVTFDLSLGKGYPDLVTLKMIRKLRDALNLTVFAFVDCDPYGVEIASVIRWGSFKQASIAKVELINILTSFLHHKIYTYILRILLFSVPTTGPLRKS